MYLALRRRRKKKYQLNVWKYIFGGSASMGWQDRGVSHSYCKIYNSGGSHCWWPSIYYWKEVVLRKSLRIPASPCCGNVIYWYTLFWCELNNCLYQKTGTIQMKDEVRISAPTACVQCPSFCKNVPTLIHVCLMSTTSTEWPECRFHIENYKTYDGVIHF